MPALDPARTPLVLVHGWAGSSAAWDAVAPALARAGLTGPIVSVDLPGSPRASDEHPATVPGAVDRVVAATEAVSAPAILIGHSMGGQITLLAHVQRPELVAAEVVVDPAYGADRAEAEGMNVWADEIAHSGADALEAFFASGFGRLPQSARDAVLADLRATTPAVLASYLRSEYLDAGAIGLFDATATVAARRSRPVFALHSSVRGADVEHALRPPTGSVVRQWNGHGHFLHLEDPARFAQELAAWLDIRKQPSGTSCVEVPRKAPPIA